MTQLQQSPPTSTQTFIPITTQLWNQGRHPVRCVKVIDETWDVKTFCFMADQPVMFFFKPGQFVTLELEINDRQVMRSYTISSSPSVPYSFSITVKRIPNGLVSNWLHENMSGGSNIAVHGPVGLFNAIDYPSKKVLLLSGGVGITPLMSMSRWYFDTNADVDISFVHSARTPRDIIYQRELEHMSSRVDNFSLHLICEKESIGLPWSGYRGFLDQQKIELIAPDFREREIFCCGPTPYMTAIKKLLTNNNFDMTHYHEESFGATPDKIEEQAVQQAAIAEVEHRISQDLDMLTINFSKTGKTISIPPSDTVHLAATQLGMTIPKACGVGLCGTCKILKTSGEVIMNHNGGITDADIAAGYILSCCSTPTSDLTIDF